MARYPEAVWRPRNGSGPYTSGPMRIVLHTTEGKTLVRALAALDAAKSYSHFVVDKYGVVQLIDTDQAARSLRNAYGGVQTNRDGAIQIEMVGFAGKPKDKAMLTRVRRLLRWIEKTHNVPRVWPNGYCKPAINGRDPGGHNRNAHNWDTLGGYYGHEHVPENTHWDPALTKEETEFLMEDGD